MVVEFSWEYLVGIVAIFVFSFLGMKVLEGKARTVAFGTAIVTGAILAGLPFEDFFSKTFEYVKENADPAGIAAGLATLSLASFHPIKQLRTPALVVAAIGTVSSLFGNWSTILSLAVVLGLITVFAILVILLVRKYLLKKDVFQ